MRRALLGSLGIALGVLGRPALAQDHPSQPSPANRAARLGRPVAAPETATPTPGITPVGLFTRKPEAPPAARPLPAGFPVQVGPPMVVAAQPGTPGTANPTPLPPPRPVGSVPTVTMIREAANGPKTDTTAVVPSVAPVAVPYDGASFPAPAVDAPLYGGTAATAPRFPALNRLVGGSVLDQYWVSAEYLLWWTKSTQVPTLLTSSSPQFNGIPGQGDTYPVLAGSFGDSFHSGARFGGGWWFGNEQRRGIDTRFLFLFRSGDDFATNTNAYPLLARPFFNANTPVGPFAEVVGAPGLAFGGVAASLQNSLWGAEVNYRRFLCGNPCARFDWLAGFRYLNFKEQLSVTETFVRTPGSPMTIGSPAVAGMIQDQFRAENNFYGGQIGMTGEIRRGRWFVDGRATIAFGTVHQTAQIGGGQALAFANGSVAQFPGGLLALPGANIGSFSQDKFAVMPEVGVNLGYHITPHLRVFVGYNFLYLSNVLRAADTIDTVVDAGRVPNFLNNPPPVLPGAPRPAPQFRESDFWAQGINFGIQWTW